MIFRILLTASLILTAGTTAYMSIYGHTQVFSTFPIPIGMMAAGLECGKLTLVVYIHRNWKKLKILARFYYCIIISALVAITGITLFGFLSQTYSETSAATRLISARETGLLKERANLREELEELEETLSGLPETYVSKRLRERERFGYMEKRSRLVKIGKELSLEESQRIGEALRAGPIFAVSRIVGIGSDLAILIFIISLVGVVEPLSVGLTVAVSTVWLRTREDKVMTKMSPEHRRRLAKQRRAAKGVKRVERQRD